MKAKPDYIAIARKYAEDVLAGRVSACKFVRLACRRQQADLERKRFKWRFDEKRAAAPCWFIENLQHVKGILAGQLIHLEPWQVWIITTVFGWIDAAGYRRYRRVYIEVPRGNGKSAMSSGVALYCLLADHEEGAEVYSLATTREQAGIVFDTAKRMTQLNAALRRAFGVEPLAHSLYVQKTGSTFRALSADGSTLDGLNIHLGVIDELHAHRTREVYDVVETGTGKRKQSLLWAITTAGSNRAGICYEVRSFVVKVLEGTAKDDQQFGIIYSLDEGDDWTTVKALEKANPNWGVSVMPDVVRGLQQKAVAMASAAANFQTKHLDIWVNADTAWMNMPKWNALADGSLTVSDFEDCDCVIGLDLATKKDICAAVKVFRRFIDGIPHYYVFGRYYLPRETIEASTNSQYSGWSAEEYLTATPGATTDFSIVADDIRDDLRRFKVQAVAYDPWQATQLASTLSDEGAPMIEVRQTVAQLSEPMKTLEALVLDGRIHHDGSPVLTWMISNVVAHVDAKDNIYPRKERPDNKIDGAVALIIALSRFVTGEDSGGANFDEFLDNMAVI
nr:MAG TPA: Large Terminase [Caudoviricetes sp.]